MSAKVNISPGLPFKRLGGDVDYIEYGGTWFSGPYRAAPGELGDYTYFFVLEWSPWDHKPGGVVAMRVMVPGMWSANEIYNKYDLLHGATAGEVTVQALLDGCPGHCIFSSEVSPQYTRAAATRDAKAEAGKANLALGFWLDAHYGWYRVRGDHPIGPADYEIRRAAILGIVLALTGSSSVLELLDEIDPAQMDPKVVYPQLELAQLQWFENWLRNNIKGYYKKGRR